jgi:hypothetical protein
MIPIGCSWVAWESVIGYWCRVDRCGISANEKWPLRKGSGIGLPLTGIWSINMRNKVDLLESVLVAAGIVDRESRNCDLKTFVVARDPIAAASEHVAAAMQ